MKNSRVWIYVLLIVYSLILVVVEVQSSQSFVRNYFSDVEGPVPFYAVNTTLSVSLLWGTALLFAVCFVCVDRQAGANRLRWFFLSQVAVFFWLGCDDRFKFHENVAERLGIGDHFVLLVVAAFQIAFLLALGGRTVLRGRRLVYMALAVVFFVVMTVFDALVPHEMLLRLTLEDLAKTWATLFFFLFAWENCCRRIHLLKVGGRPVPHQAVG